MAINQVNTEMHKVVVIFKDNYIGFSSLTMAIGFIEQAYLGEDYTKVMNRIATALSDDKDEDLQIFDIATYADLFMDEDEDGDDE